MDLVLLPIRALVIYSHHSHTTFTYPHLQPRLSIAFVHRKARITHSLPVCFHTTVGTESDPIVLHLTINTNAPLLVTWRVVALLTRIRTIVSHCSLFVVVFVSVCSDSTYRVGDSRPWSWKLISFMGNYSLRVCSIKVVNMWFASTLQKSRYRIEDPPPVKLARML